MPINIDLNSFLIILFVAVLMSMLVSWLFMSYSTVKKSEYKSLEGNLVLQKSINQQQESKLSELNRIQAVISENYQKEKELNQFQQISLQKNQNQIIQLNKEVAGLAADNRSLLDKLDSQMETFQEMRQTSKIEFENLASKLLEEKSKNFEEEHKKGLKEVLAPLKEKIKSFEEKVEVTNKESIARHSSLKEQIIGLRNLNEKMSSEAIKLTKALKQDSKTQGNWGEIILESILEKSGLEKDREYFVQSSLKNPVGKTMRPDIVVSLPDAKKIIIDSKVSLTAYEQLINSIDEVHKKHSAKAHSSSIKKHIDGLASKNYHELYEIESPDFVLMFVPIETAFSAALQEDKKLYSYAFEKNIVVVTPSTLLATLKTVESLWQNEKQQKYALEIANEAGKMYDKFTAFVDDLEGIGKRIDQTQSVYQESMKKLHSGNGNLISRAEKLKKLGAKANKTLSSELVSRAGNSKQEI